MYKAEKKGKSHTKRKTRKHVIYFLVPNLVHHVDDEKNEAKQKEVKEKIT